MRKIFCRFIENRCYMKTDENKLVQRTNDLQIGSGKPRHRGKKKYSAKHPDKLEFCHIRNQNNKNKRG